MDFRCRCQRQTIIWTLERGKKRLQSTKARQTISHLSYLYDGQLTLSVIPNQLENAGSNTWKLSLIRGSNDFPMLGK
ncbi:MAG: hypothetical protein LC437_09255, partial [Thiohalomonas sp.]|nr:hypothetical protein [Thiohalomonas sp.]